MIVDTFLYAGERDLLDLRMCHLQDKVDLFVAVEGALTFTGQPREIDTLPAQSNLIHLIVSDFPEAKPTNPWKREAHQRNAILRALNGLYDTDLILVSDVDEIPNHIPKRVDAGEVCCFFQQWYQFYLNRRVTNDIWHGTRMCQLQTLRKLYPQGVRNYHTQLVVEGGWHFSWLGNASVKLKSYSHIELAQLQGTIPERVAERWHLNYETIEGAAYLPDCIKEDLDKYARYFDRAGSSPVD